LVHLNTLFLGIISTPNRSNQTPRASFPGIWYTLGPLWELESPWRSWPKPGAVVLRGSQPSFTNTVVWKPTARGNPPLILTGLSGIEFSVSSGRAANHVNSRLSSLAHDIAISFFDRRRRMQAAPKCRRGNPSCCTGRAP
jgi:hypothetical protein